MKKTIITLTIIAALALSLAGCSSAPAAEPETPAAENEAAAPEAQVTADVPSPTEEDGQTASPETPAVPGRQDGERFEAVIMLEGMDSSWTMNMKTWRDAPQTMASASSPAGTAPMIPGTIWS